MFGQLSQVDGRQQTANIRWSMVWSTVDSRRPTAGSRLVLPLPLAMAQAKDGTGAPPTIRTLTEKNPQSKEFI